MTSTSMGRGGQEVADVLERAADLIEPEGAWMQVGGCRGMPGATCAYNAIAKEGHSKRWSPAADFFARFVTGDPDQAGPAIWRWNDAPERTQAEVVAKLREAAALARRTA